MIIKLWYKILLQYSYVIVYLNWEVEILLLEVVFLVIVFFVVLYFQMFVIFFLYGCV